MAKVRLSDLSPAAQAQVAEKLGAPPKRSRGRTAPKEPGLPLRCLSCGETIPRPSDSALARHGCHGRYEWTPDTEGLPPCR